MSDRRHSAVFDVLTSVMTSVYEAPYPAHEATQRVPALDSGVLPPEAADEYVTVALAVEDDATVAWARLSPGGRDEIVPVDVEIGTKVPGRTAVQVLARLEELADVVQGCFYNPTTHQYTPPSQAVQLGGLEGVSCNVWGTDQGHAGQAVARFRFTCRI